MKYISKELEAAVLKEALAINKYATEAEIKKLVISTLEPDSFYSCIYGSMTGDCRNDRAIELITNCTVIVVNSKFVFDKETKDYSIDGGDLELESKDTCAIDTRNQYSNKINCFSPIETAILRNKSIIPKIIKVIKGKSKTL